MFSQPCSIVTFGKGKITSDAALIIFNTDGNRKEVNLGAGETIVGRRPDCDLRVPLQVFSRRHFLIKREGDELTVKDLNSSNGTMLNNKPLTQHAVKVKAGDLIKAGSIKFLFKINGDLGKYAKVESSPDDFDIGEYNDDSRVGDALTMLESRSDDSFFGETESEDEL